METLESWKHRGPRSSRAAESRGRHPINVDPAVQRRLLDVQALDVRLDQLAHRRSTVAEKQVVEELIGERKALDSASVAADTQVADLTRAQKKAEADVDQVRTRRTRDEERLNAGRVASPRELESLQHEIESLIKRQSDLEDVELEIMERLEAATTEQADVRARLEEVTARLAAAEEALRAVYAEIDAEAEKVRGERAAQAEGIDPPLLALYEKQRELHGGIGAAALRQRRCEGCRMELDVTFLTKLRSLPAETVARCEECGRILVRTPESGL